MRFLALDCSTNQASMALLEQDVQVSATTWFEERSRHEILFDAGAHLMAKTNWQWAELDAYVVGRGPGAYSGLRVSLLAAQAWAAPGNKPVIAVSSMEAAARSWLEQEQSDELLVVGDARRNTYWHGLVRRTDPLPVEWKVADRENVLASLEKAELIGTPHPEVQRMLSKDFPAHAWIPQPMQPTATAVAWLARHRMHHGTAPEPLLPIYLHAAV